MPETEVAEKPKSLTEQLREQNRELAAKAAKLEAENAELRAENMGELAEKIDESYQKQLLSLQEFINSEFDRGEKSPDETPAEFLIRMFKRQTAPSSPDSEVGDGQQEFADYELTPITDGNPCSRYDGLDDGLFIQHEALTLREYNGYSQSALQDWAKSSIERAMGADGGWRMGDLDERGRPTCDNLPPFSPDRVLEVIVRIL